MLFFFFVFFCFFFFVFFCFVCLFSDFLLFQENTVLSPALYYFDVYMSANLSLNVIKRRKEKVQNKKKKKKKKKKNIKKKKIEFSVFY